MATIIDRGADRWLTKAAHAHSQIIRFLQTWADAADRKQPVPAEIAARAKRLVRVARKLLARVPGTGIRPLPRGPLLPGVIVVALLRAAAALGVRSSNLSNTPPA